MMNSDILNVWHDDQLVGQLKRDASGRMTFQYEHNWLNNGFAISQQLPLKPDQHQGNNNSAHQFFANLLPEANARNHIIRDLKIADTDFDLLKAIGGECAGALRILSTDEKPARSPKYETISSSIFTKLLRRKGSLTAFNPEESPPRLSLAGAQDKCPIFVDGSQYFLPQGDAPSTHIIKFEVSEYRHILAYEYFLNKLAKSIGLPVVECSLKKTADGYFLLIKRFDRYTDKNGKVIRLHQEDFCQALGFGYEKKYQQDGGPSFKACYELTQQISMKPIEDAENLLKWQIFNILAGNSDGHAKNIALLYDEQHNPKLAPFYDLVCTRAIERIDIKLAFSMGGEFNPNKLDINHWLALAKECQVRERYFTKLIQLIANELTQKLPIVKKQFENEHTPYPALQRVELIVEKQCKKILKQLN
jgi:serine/threonine-protein kinase HipA